MPDVEIESFIVGYVHATRLAEYFSSDCQRQTNFILERNNALTVRRRILMSSHSHSACSIRV